MLIRVLDRFWGGAGDFAPADRYRARLAAGTLLVGIAFFTGDALSQAARSNLPFVVMEAATALSFLALLALARFTRPVRVGHGIAAILAIHVLFKIAVTGGETRSFAILAIAPMLVIPLCGLRGGVAWSLGMCAGIAALAGAEFLGLAFPWSFDAHRVPHHTYAVGIGAGLVSLSLAAWYRLVYLATTRELKRNEALAARAQLELLETHERNRALLEHAFDGVVVLDENLRLSYLSKGSETQVLGYSSDVLGNGTLAEFGEQILHPEDRPDAMAAFAQCLETPGKLVRTTIRLRKRAGGYARLDATIHNLTQDPAVGGIVINYRDVSDQDETVRGSTTLGPPDLQARALATFAAGVAHEFNNLMTIVLGGAYSLQQPERRDSWENDVRAIQDAANRGGRVARDVLLYAGEVPPALELIDLPSFLSDIWAPLLTTVVSGVRLDLRVPDDMPAVWIDPEMVRRAITELVNNTLEAGGGLDEPIVVRVAHQVADRESLQGVLDFSEGGLVDAPCVVLSVEDRAGGIAAEHRERIYDPFFSTRFLGRGLGLAAVLGAVRAHRGAIRMETSDAPGTRVTLFLPAE